MNGLLKYYSHNNPPNDEELRGCIDLAEKAKQVVLLYYAETPYTNDTDVRHVFIHPDDSFESVKARMNSNYKIH